MAGRLTIVGHFKGIVSRTQDLHLMPDEPEFAPVWLR